MDAIVPVVVAVPPLIVPMLSILSLNAPSLSHAVLSGSPPPTTLARHCSTEVAGQSAKRHREPDRPYRSTTVPSGSNVISTEGPSCADAVLAGTRESSGATTRLNRKVATATAIVATITLGFTCNRSLLSHQWRLRNICQIPISNSLGTALPFAALLMKRPWV